MTDALPPANTQANAAIAASPLATGDYGGRYQDAVDGWFLSHLLMGTGVAGVPGTLARVGFQRRTHGALLDDTVIETAGGPTVQFSIKAGITIARGDAELRETLTLAWTRAQGPANDWSGLVAPPSASGIGIFAHLLFLAHKHDDVADFVRAISTPNVVAAPNRQRFAACRTILDDVNRTPVTDAQFHSFLRRFVVVQLDFAIPPSRAHGDIVAMLSSVQRIEREQALSLFERLVAISEELAIASAARDRPALIGQLRRENVTAGLPADLRPQITAINEYALRTFESRNDAVAGVRLDRKPIVDAIATTLMSGKGALLTGPSGYGKSAVIRAAYGKYVEGGPVLHISGRRLATVGSWAELADDIGIPQERARLAEILNTNAHGATLILDATEHVQEARARQVLNDLLRDLNARCGSLNVLIATRDLLITDVLQWLDVSTIPALENITLGALATEEVARIADASPPLGALIARIGTNLIPGGLFILGLLHDERIPSRVLAETPATEGDLLDVWWDHVLVGRDANRHNRLTITRTAASEVVRVAGGLFRLPIGLDGGTIASLEVDGILVLDRRSDRYRFGHDIIQDWAVVRWLDGEAGATRAHISALAQVPGFYRCVALFAQRLAEREPRRFDELWRAQEDSRDQRGQHALLSALALSSQATRLLDERANELLESQGYRLGQLLTLLSIEQIDVNVAALDLAIRHGVNIGTATSFAIENGMPRHLVWAPALRFCLEHLDALDHAMLPFVKMAERWQKTTPPGFPIRAPLFTATMRILAQLESWQKREASPTVITITYDDSDAVAKSARSAVAHATDVDPAAVAAYLADLRENGWSNAQDDMLTHVGVMGASLTGDVVDFTVAMLTAAEPRAPWEANFSDLGLVPHKYFPASDVQGPFLALLRNNETAGLVVARRLVQRASERYQRREAQGPNGAHWRPLTFTFRDRTVTVRGDERAYNWFRPGSHDSDVLTSVLMAVDTWALEAVRNGRNPGDIADLLLSDTDAAAFLGIVIGLAYDAPGLAPELVDVVAQPWMWRYERAREQLDSMPNDFNAILPAELRMPAFRLDIEQHNRARDAARTSMRLPMKFAANYLFGDDRAIRDQFIAKAAKMDVSDACLWIEEQAQATDSTDARDLFAQFRSFVNPEDYEVIGNQVQWRPPATLLPSAEEQRLHAIRQAMLACDLTGAAALRDYKSPDNVAAYERVGQAAEAELAAGRFTDQDLEYARQSVPRCAAVSVTFGAQGHAPPTPWAIKIIREAAQAQAANNWAFEDDDGEALDMRISLAAAAGALLAANPDDDELRTLVFRSAAVAPPNTGASLLRGLTPAWTTRPQLPINVLLVLLGAALRDGNGSLSDREVDVYLSAESAGAAGATPNFATPSKRAMHRVSRVLKAAHATFEQPTTVDVLMPLCEALLALIKPRDAEEDDAVSVSLTSEVARFAADIFVALPASGHEPFRAAVGNWVAAPDFYGEAVLAIIHGHIGFREISDRAFERFREMAQSFLAANHRVELERSHLSTAFQKTCRALIFVEDFVGVIVLERWPHAARFVEHIGQWVEAVGAHPTTASALIAFISRFASAFSSTQLIGWIDHAATGTSAHLQGEFWRRNGEAIATLFLLLLSERPEDFREAALRGTAAAIGDRLVSTGVALGGEIRRTLEIPRT